MSPEQDNESLEPLIPSTEKRVFTKEAKISYADRLLVWACYATFACVAANLLVLVLPSYFATSPLSQRQLERPSVYYGLETLPRNATVSTRSFVNYPVLFTQISAREPRKVFPDDVARWLTSQGTVSPDEKRVFLDHDTTSVAQFRARDWRMESCKIVASIPTDVQKLYEADSRRRMKEFTLRGDTSQVEVWALEGHSGPPVAELSYSTRPQQANLLGTLHLALGHNSSTAEFACTSGLLYAFEFRCVSPDCIVEFYQGHKSLGPVIYLEQSSSL